MKTFKKVIALAGSAAVLMSLGACGSGSQPSSSSGKLSGNIKFQTWNLKRGTYVKFFNDMISKFEKAHPGTKIQWVDQPSDGYEQKLSADAAAGQLPDVIDLPPTMGYMLAQAGALLDVGKEAPKAEKNYTKGGWEAVTFQGENIPKAAYGFPWYVNDGPVYYNTDLMKQCGLDENKLPHNWDEYFEAANTVVKNCKGKAYMSTAVAGDIGDLASAKIPIMNKDHTKYTFNTPEAAKFIQRFVDLYKAGGIPAQALDATWSQQGTWFQQGNLVETGGSAYQADDFKTNSPDLFKKLKVGPKITDTDHSVTVGYEMVAISKQTKSKDLALEFAQYVTNSENQLGFDKLASVFPSSAGTFDDPYFAQASSGSDVKSQALKLTIKAVKDGIASRPPQFTDANGENYYTQQVALAIQGKQTPQEALDKAVKFANSRLSLG